MDPGTNICCFGQNQLSVQVKCVLLWWLDKAMLHIRQFFTRNYSCCVYGPITKCTPVILPSRSKSRLLSHGTPFHNLIVLTWDSHSIKHHPLRAYLKQPVTHVRARFTVGKTLLYDSVRCGSLPSAFSQYPATLLLFLTTAQTNWSLWDFVELFCTFCDLKFSQKMQCDLHF